MFTSTKHQDYGYWYDNGCLFPDMASCLIAIDPATKKNGCLQILEGSQRLGRVNHGRERRRKTARLGSPSYGLSFGQGRRGGLGSLPYGPGHRQVRVNAH